MAAKEKSPHRRTSIHDIPGDALDIILQHITFPTTLVHAAATCKLWRRVIGDGSFLRRFRCLNRPYMIGQYHFNYIENESGMTDFLPFPAPAGEIAIDDDTVDEHTSLYFLTTYYSNLNSAELHDSRGGLLAFHHSLGSSIIICNPWTREHTEIYPPMPRANTETLFHGIYLLDADPTRETCTDLNMSNFSVLFLRLVRRTHNGRKTVEASVFSARDNSWSQLGAMSVGNNFPAGDFSEPPFVLVGRAGGSICWCNRSSKVVLHLDVGTGKFALFTMPPVPAGVNMNTLYYYNSSYLRVIGSDAGTVHLVRIVGGDIEVLRYARGGGGRACVVERRAFMTEVTVRERWPRQLRCFVDRANEVAAHGSITLSDVLCDTEFSRKFAAGVQNLKLGRVKGPSDDGGRSFPYELPWTISVCL